MTTPGRRATLPLALLIAVSGCSAQPAQRPVDLAAVMITANVTKMRLSSRLAHAENLLDQRCMRELGYDYLVEEETEPGTNTLTEDEVGIGRPATYGVKPPRTEAPAEDRYVNSLAEPLRTRYLAALYGPNRLVQEIRMPSGRVDNFVSHGCVAEVRSRMYGSNRAAIVAMMLPTDVRNLFGGFLETDQDYQSALTSWQGCMAAAGWPLKTPMEAMLNLMKLPAEQLAVEQPVVADADVTCDGQTGLRERTARARVKFLKAQPASVVDQLAGAYQARDHALAVVADLVD